LEQGQVWLGTAGNNPISSPITAYWDAALTQVVTQPVTTRGGYPLNGTAVGRLYVNADYSILVRNRSGSDVLSAQNATERYDSSLVTFIQAGAGAVTRTAQAKMRDIVSVKDFGAVGDGVADDTVAIQAAIDSLTPYQTLNIDSKCKISSGLTITNKTNIRITGNGWLAMSGASSSAYVFLLVGTIDDLEIDGIKITGDGNAAYTQGAIGNNSGQTISSVKFHDLTIEDVNVGIELNANLGGSYSKALVYNNRLKNILGAVAGAGYGIVLAKAYYITIYGNLIDNASRHSIYCGSGQNIECIIDSNTIINHRSTVAIGSPRCAIDIGRCSGVTVSNNRLRDCYDGMLYIAHETSTTQSCENVLITGNSFSYRKNAVPFIVIGEQLAPTSYTTSKVSIINNVFEDDISITANSAILINNGTQINIEGNRYRAYSVTATLPIFVEAGNAVYLSSNNQIGDIVIRNNVATADATVAGSRLVYITTRLCTGTGVCVVKDNQCAQWASEFAFEATPTNPNTKFKFRTTVTHDFPSVSANSGTYTPKSILGVKPTSMVTGNCQSFNISGGNDMVFTFYPTDVGVNTIIIQINNVTTSAYDPPSQSFVINIEDI